MSHIINSNNWVLPVEVIRAASLAGSTKKLQFVYLSDEAKKNDNDFLFFKDEERTDPAFVVDKWDL